MAAAVCWRVAAKETSGACRGPVLTVGHSTRAFEQFTELLLANGVTLLVDVRRFPHSRRHPQFDKESLSERLHDACGVSYSHLPGLGGRRHPRSDSPNASLAQPLLPRLRRPHANARVRETSSGIYPESAEDRRRLPLLKGRSTIFGNRKPHP